MPAPILSPISDMVKKNRLARLFKLIYLKLFRINDSPQRIAVGFGLGVFLGILPGTGPLAALFLAVIFRVNRASAFLGSLLTNTWISVVAFLSAVKLGSFMLGLDWKKTYSACSGLFHSFGFGSMFKTAAWQLLFPVFLGYLVIGVIAGSIAYLLVLIFKFALKSNRPANTGLTK